ncbi:hypothetical protein IW261DRAFT_1419028 [Armillaria novae-zelandiae]|uniref:F-box domain-containing protein n=1 Tax=Armillaria novae-zelandiae TaxID=153914 RepID=A0AA39UFU6_9AGAR|nr:hypothetical protein IW261DRAFT_1419028 [Armillaria novae-zelandiae]
MVLRGQLQVEAWMWSLSLMEPILLCDNCGQSFDTQAPSLRLDADTYLRSGREINASETELCSRTTIDLQKKISEYDAAVSRLNTTLEKLQANRRSLARCAQKFASLLSPIRRLPRDVLGEIFAFICTSVSHDAFLARDDLPLVSTTPFYLSSVCAYWRAVCTSSPLLWTSVLANIGRRGASLQFLRATELFRQRSGARLVNLQLSVEFGEFREGVGYEDVQRRLRHAVTSLFCSPDALNLQRLKRIGIDSRTVHLWDVFRKGIQPEFPELEHLEFSDDVEYSGVHPIKLFEYAPKLHTLALNAFHSTSFRLRNEQITTVYFANVPSFVYPSRTHSYPNATTATFRRCGYLSFEDAEFPFRRLVLHGCLPAFHWMGSMPHLASLELVDIDCTNSSESDDIRNTICDLAKYLSKSPLLTELVLNTLIIGHPEMLSLLHAVPQLRRLSIVERVDTRLRVISPRFIEELRDLEMLRELEHLQLVWSDEADEGAILDVLEKRPLKSAVIGIREGGELGPDTLSRIDALRKSGTAVTLW